MVSRRLERVGRGREFFIETVSYLMPVLLLTALGTFLRWRRRHTPALSSSASGDLTIRPVSQREV
jgi:cytochrome c biogenesis factor